VGAATPSTQYTILQQYANVTITEPALKKAFDLNESTVMATALISFLTDHSAAIGSYKPRHNNSQETHDNIIAQACALYRIILTEYSTNTPGKDPLGNKDVIQRLQKAAGPLMEAAVLGAPYSSKRNSLSS